MRLPTGGSRPPIVLAALVAAVLLAGAADAFAISASSRSGALRSGSPVDAASVSPGAAPITVKTAPVNVAVRAPAVTSAGPDTVTVQATGVVQGTPDVVDLSLGVQAKRSNAADALDAANADVNRVLNALRHEGVADRDIQTTSVFLNPDYTYGQGAPHLDGYQAGQSITAKLRHRDRMGSTISKAATAAGNDVTINGLSFDLEHDDSLVVAARERAFSGAQSEATQYAQLAGRSLGRVLSISEVYDTATPMPEVGAASAGVAGGGASAVPVAVGQTPVSVMVTVSWALR